MQTIPVLVVGDAPNLPSGLARITRDLCSLLFSEAESLGLKLFQAGIRYDGSPWPWRVWSLDEGAWGEEDIGRIWEWVLRESQAEAGVLFSVWDPGRCFGTSEVKLPGCERWGYFPIDSHNQHGKVSGPALQALRRYKRVLGYGNWGAQVLRVSLNKPEVSWLPHGLGENFGYSPEETRSPVPLLGCVAANQPRKDFGLFFRAAAFLRDFAPEWKELGLWIHTDQEATAAWCLPQLAEDFGFNTKKLQVTEELDDASLEMLYRKCWATFAPGLGEGFGYPIVESLACGTPVVHGEFGGGAELLPKKDWLASVAETRLEGAYAQVRPVYRATEVAYLLHKAMKWVETEPEVAGAYCAASITHLRWESLWPRWRGWWAKGLRELREAGK